MPLPLRNAPLLESGSSSGCGSEYFLILTPHTYSSYLLLIHYVRYVRRPLLCSIENLQVPIDFIGAPPSPAVRKGVSSVCVCASISNEFAFFHRLPFLARRLSCNTPLSVASHCCCCTIYLVHDLDMDKIDPNIYYLPSPLPLARSWKTAARIFSHRSKHLLIERLHCDGIRYGLNWLFIYLLCP